MWGHLAARLVEPGCARRHGTPIGDLFVFFCDDIIQTQIARRLVVRAGQEEVRPSSAAETSAGPEIGGAPVRRAVGEAAEGPSARRGGARLGVPARRAAQPAQAERCLVPPAGAEEHDEVEDRDGGGPHRPDAQGRAAQPGAPGGGGEGRHRPDAGRDEAPLSRASRLVLVSVLLLARV